MSLEQVKAEVRTKEVLEKEYSQIATKLGDLEYKYQLEKGQLFNMASKLTQEAHALSKVPVAEEVKQ